MDEGPRPEWGLPCAPQGALQDAPLPVPACSLLQQEALLAQLRECPSLRDLRQLLEGLAATGHLRRLATTLLTQRVAAVTAVLGQAPEHALAPRAASPSLLAAGADAGAGVPHAKPAAVASTTHIGSASAGAAAADATGAVGSAAEGSRAVMPTRLLVAQRVALLPALLGQLALLPAWLLLALQWLLPRQSLPLRAALQHAARRL